MSYSVVKYNDSGPVITLLFSVFKVTGLTLSQVTFVLRNKPHVILVIGSDFSKCSVANEKSTALHFYEKDLKVSSQ